MEEVAAIKFQAGDEIVYPQYGLGRVVEVLEKHIGEASMMCYRLTFATQHLEVLVPVEKAPSKGLRRVMSEAEAEAILERFLQPSARLAPQQWRRWRKETQEQLKSSNPGQIADIYTYLCSMEQAKELSFTERKILRQVEHILCSEIAAAKGIPPQQALLLIKAQISTHIPVAKARPSPLNAAKRRSLYPLPVGHSLPWLDAAE